LKQLQYIYTSVRDKPLAGIQHREFGCLIPTTTITTVVQQAPALPTCGILWGNISSRYTDCIRLFNR